MKGLDGSLYERNTRTPRRRSIERVRWIVGFVAVTRQRALLKAGATPGGADHAARAAAMLLHPVKA